jgi:predicted Zn-dependent protease
VLTPSLRLLAVSVLVATLAVAPALAQLQPKGQSPPPNDLGTPMVQDAQARDPASAPLPDLSNVPINQRIKLPPALTQPVVNGPAEPQEPRKLDPKYDLSRIGARPVGKGVNLYSLEKEQKLGRELASELNQYVRLINDPIVTEYVNRIGQNLVRNSDAQVPFTIQVIENDEVNAFSLPGGYLYVNTGMILAADSEAALAGVMAHEIAHVAARHATRQKTRGLIWNLASIPLVFAGGPAGYAVRQVSGIALPMSGLKFSRDAEREADLLGLEYEYAAGYDPAELVRFFEKLKLDEGKNSGFLARAFSTHPMTKDRINRAQKLISTVLPSRDQYVVSTNEFDEVQQRLLGLSGPRLNKKHESGGPVLRRRMPEHDGRQGGGNTDDKHPH